MIWVKSHDDPCCRLPLLRGRPQILALPRSVTHWSLTTLREKLVKIGAKVVTHARYVTFQMAEATTRQRLFKIILRQISRVGPLAPAPT